MTFDGRTVLRAAGRWVAGAVVVGVLMVAGIVVRTLQTGHADDAGPVDAVVVLGAAQYNGTPSPVYRARLDHALELYRAGVAPRVVTIGGGQPGDRTTEGATGREYLLEQGVPTSDLIAVGTGSDTLASLRATAGVLEQNDWHSVVLVTDPAHAHRAALMAADQGLRVGTSSVTEGPAAAADVQLRYYARETLGTLYYLLIGGSSGSGTPVL